jgi:hypothetical protein
MSTKQLNPEQNIKGGERLEAETYFGGFNEEALKLLERK